MNDIIHHIFHLRYVLNNKFLFIKFYIAFKSRGNISGIPSYNFIDFNVSQYKKSFLTLSSGLYSMFNVRMCKQYSIVRNLTNESTRMFIAVVNEVLDQTFNPSNN